MGGPGDSPWHRGGRGHRSGRGDPRPVPTLGCDHQPSPTHCPHPQQSPFPHPCPVWPPPICSSPGRGRGGTSWSREASCRAGVWAVTEAAFLRWSWKTRQRGHRRDEPPHPAGDTLCPSKCPAKHPLPGLWGPGRAAPVIRKCKRRNNNGKSENSVRVQPLTHGRHSSCLESLFSLFLEQGCDPGHSGAAGATSLMGTPSNKLSKCVYIYLYIFISIYLSLSHAALGTEEEQTAKPEVWMGAPVCREQGQPKAHSHTALASTSGFFPSLYFTAVP